PFCGTFHSFCVRLLRQDADKIGLDNHFVIYDEDDSIAAIKKAVKNLDLDIKPYKPQSFKAAISAAKNELVASLEYSSFARGRFQELTATIYREYDRLLKKFSAQDFDDLLLNAVKLLQNNQETLNKYRLQFEYFLVDEYQDTNKAQYELTRLLTSRWRNLTAVGDFSQSIYSWRGADYRNLLRLKENFPDLTIINLEQNYRSTQNILSAANQVIVKNTLHPILNLWTKSGSGNKLAIYEARDEKDESDFVVQIIKPGKNLNRFAVLYRTNAQSRTVEEAFIKHGIPYLLVGGTRFYSRKEIKDCLAYLRFLSNPKDSIGYERLEKLGQRRLKLFLDWEQTNRQAIKSLTTTQILDRVLKATHYLDRFDIKDEADLMRLENVKELRTVAREFPQLQEFLENVALVEQSDPAPREGRGKLQKNVVTLMTLHASKGLEFDTVFLIGMEEGLFPHSRSLLSRDELEEERRLCYVGITRAKTQVYFTYSLRRLYFGQYSSNSVSRFLADIDTNLLELSHAHS
ncbi:UvrD-helicase domain-containing protein, partial [Patescibacteria group bacterium]|nr:UvrD-helicase domain-containing protein [Patescibacteria group bacterium]